MLSHNFVRILGNICVRENLLVQRLTLFIRPEVPLKHSLNSFVHLLSLPRTLTQFLQRKEPCLIGAISHLVLARVNCGLWAGDSTVV